MAALTRHALARFSFVRSRIPQPSCRPTAAGSHAGKSAYAPTFSVPRRLSGHSIDGYARHAPPRVTRELRITQNEVAVTNRLAQLPDTEYVGALYGRCRPARRLRGPVNQTTEAKKEEGRAA